MWEEEDHGRSDEYDPATMGRRRDRVGVLRVPDLHGTPRSKRIPLAAAEGFARDGLNMCGATLALGTGSEVVPHTGYVEEISDADLLLFPDWSTAAVVPWAPRTARVICDPDADRDAADGLSVLVTYAVGGMLAHAPACMVLFAPTLNCYRRYRIGTFAPANVSWGHEDRTAAVRVKGVRGQATRIENRLPTAVANPYLIVAGVVSAMVDGLRNRIEPPPPTPSGSTAYANPSASPLPASLSGALGAFEQDEVMRHALDEEFLKVFTVVKRHEIDKWNNYVSDWERHEYLDLV